MPAPSLDARHFDRLLALLDREAAAQREQLDALRRDLSLDQQSLRGIAFVDLEATDERLGLAGRVLVDYEPALRGEALEGRLRPGDPVRVRTRRDDEPVEGVIAARARARVTVAFHQPPPGWATGGRVVIELLPDERTLARARDAVVRARDLSPFRAREWLLGQRPPAFGPGPGMALEPRVPLNPEQREALARALSADELALVHGPPGTGKTAVLGEVARHAVKRGERVLATAASNAAVDHLLEVCLDAGLRVLRVGHPARVSERLQGHTLDARVLERAEREGINAQRDEAYGLLGYARRQRARGRSGDRFANAREAQAEARRMLDEARAAERRIIDDLLRGAQVVCATLSVVAGLELPKGVRFDLALLDEATQAVEPVTYHALLAARRVVMAGDHRQLPPTVISPEAARDGLAVSLFERLVALHGGVASVMLREQHRMHEDIMALPSRAFYGGALRAHPAVAGHTLAALVGEGVDAPPVLFLDTAGRGWDDAQPPGTDSRANDGEAEVVALRARELLDAGLPPRDLAVITPYAAQARRIRERTRALGVDDAVEVDTVDAFQGREKEAVLVSLVRSNAEGAAGFVRDLRRLNVALTRARRHLFVVGDGATLGGEAFLGELIEHAQARGGYRSVWEWPAALAL
jgi:ATP-dependent RNA/DNA helicase IGHMBP2